MIKIEGLTVSVPSFQIRDLDITIEEGTFHFLLGPTGSGKTLILESIIGLRKPSRGKVWIAGREVQNFPPETREISYVPQDLALFPHLTVKDNILYGIQAKRLDLADYEHHVRNLIEVMRIDPLLDRYPAHLSGGEKKRVALLRALAPQPRLLLLDEPLSGLDPSIRIEIQHLLKILHASFHPTTLCVTHDFEEAYFLADEITICIDGKSEQAGTKDEVFLKPKSRKVAQFLGARNLYHAKILRREEDVPQIILGVLGVPVSVPLSRCPHSIEPGNDVDLLIRPEEIMILREGKPVKDALKRNIFQGRIVDLLDRGRYWVVYVEASDAMIPFEISIPHYAFRNLNLSMGQAVHVALRDESLWVMPAPSSGNQ
jgi:ABC-type Fe3+/spermidine/putrescine transport system ATPase subunit